MENVSYHVASGAIDKELLYDVICSVISEPEIIEEINQFSWPDVDINFIKDLGKEVAKYKFKEAGQILEKLSEHLLL